MQQNIKERLENLNNTAVRSEFKLEIYQIYILPSIRFLLTVHDLPITYLTKLDTMADQYLKKWAGLPRCATNAILHLDTALNIKKISTLYKETHAVSHASTRLKGDSRVNLALDNRLARESNYTRKQSITVESEKFYRSAFGRNTVQGEIPGTTPENVQLSQDPVNLSFTEEICQTPAPSPTCLEPPTKFINDVKLDVKAMVSVEQNEATFNHVRTLIKQGKFLELSKCEQTDATWQGYIYNLPKGTMKWVLNASIDTLPTKVNLKQWGKVNNDKCFCGQRQTLNHILNCCKVSLNQGRYTYRHDNILTYIAKCLDHDKFTCYIDIEGHQTPAGGTLPPNVIVTTLKPDIVIIDKKAKSINIFELTVPGEGRLDISHKLKKEKYQHFETDISTYSATVTPFEIGSNTGFINRDNKLHLHKLHKYCKRDIKLKSFKNNISAISVSSSYYLFNFRNIESWEKTDPILAPLPNQ